MLFTLIPAGAVEPETAYDAGESTFDFEAAKYSVKENEGEISVKILRRGDANAPVNVAVKAADFLAEYGRDYEILLDGEAFSAQKGEIVDPSMFTFDSGQPVGETEESRTEATEAVTETEKTSAEAGEAATETEEAAAETEKAATETAEAVTETEEAATETAETVTETEEPAAETGEASSETAETATETEEASSETAETATETEEASSETAETVTETEEPAAETEEAATETAEPVADTEAATDTAETSTETEKAVTEAEEAATETKEPAAETEEAATETAEAVTETEEAASETAETVEEVSLSNDAALAGVQFAETPAVSVETPGVSFDVPTTEGDTAEPVADTEAATDTAEPVADATEAVDQTTETPSRVYKKSNSPLRDARDAYLGVPEDENNQQTQDALEEITKNLHQFFEDAQGAQGIVYFAPGVTERVLTVRVMDNDTADGPRMFLMSLLGTDSDRAAVALNNNVVVTIEDDEAYEPSTFSLSASAKTLTADKPTATVKVSRTGGLQYFSTAYVSTVAETALSGAYEKLNYREVGFIPGQTEAEVTVTAKAFTGGTFGLRLEAREPDSTRKHYLTFTIEELEEPRTDDETAVLQDADGDTLGRSSHSYVYFDSSDSADAVTSWGSVRNGGNKNNRAENGYEELYVANLNKGQYSMLYSTETFNLTGVKNMFVYMTVGGGGSKKWTFFGVSDNRNWNVTSAKGCYDVGGNMNWRVCEIGDVASMRGEHYVKFGTQCNGNDAKAWVDEFWFDYLRYEFDLEDSPRNFERQLYDFSQSTQGGAPLTSGIYYEGESSTSYNPGPVKIEYDNGGQKRDVKAFYANANQTVTFRASEEARNRGYELEGLYFVKRNHYNDVSAGTLWDKTGYTNIHGNMVYYVQATNGTITRTLGPGFIEELIGEGVVNATQAGDYESIRIFPRYKQPMAEVCFENTDRPANASKAYDGSHLASHFANVIEAYDAYQNNTRQKDAYWTGLEQKTDDNNGVTYYSTTVPKGSVVRVKSIPSADRVAGGAIWESGDQSGLTYHKAGDKIVSGRYAEGQTLTETDLTVSDIVVNGDVTLRPKTGEQTFYVGWFPGADLPNEFEKLRVELPGSGTASDPYLISSSGDWNKFCDALEDNDNWDRFRGKTVKLTADITATRMAGNAYHDFCGTFDGDGHTITVRFSSAEEGAALFHYVSEYPVIKNLRVAGSIATSAKCAGGIVGLGYGQLTLTNCRSSVTINSSVNGDGTHGGLIGVVYSPYTITGCVFDGRIMGWNTHSCGGFVGWNAGSITIKDCLYNPSLQTVSNNNSATFARNWSETPTNSYYVRSLGAEQGQQAYAIAAGNNVTIDYGAPVTNYDASGLAAYANGLMCNGVFYAGEGESVTFSLSGADDFRASAGTLTKSGSNYSLTMPAGDVVITTSSDTTSGRFPGSGTEADPYLISSSGDWYKFCDALEDNDTWNRFIGKTVKLTNDISVLRMAGEPYHDFCGTFDGNGHTLTFHCTTTEEGAAPFHYVSEYPVIKNLRVAGTINTSGKYAGGIVGFGYGQLTLTNCRCSININSSINGDGIHGGLIGVVYSPYTITGCVFDGQMLGANTHSCGGFVGWNNSSVTIKDCLYNPYDQTVSNTNSTTFVRNWNGTPTNSYYVRTLGEAQGQQAYSVTAKSNITLAYGSPAVTYNVSGISSYGKGLLFDGVFYAGKDDGVTMFPNSLVPSGSIVDRFNASAGQFTDYGGAYVLTMPDSNVTVEATFKPGDRTHNLENLVFDASNNVTERIPGVNTADANGAMNLADPYLGKTYSLRANPPDGYYTYWVRMTGDTDNSGDISDIESIGRNANVNKDTEYLYGNTISVKLEQDNTRYYYQFIPATSSANANAPVVTGQLLRQDTTLMNLVKRNTDSKPKMPVSGAYVNVAGYDGTTDAKGRYSIRLADAMPLAGNVSATFSKDGRTYYQAGKIEKYVTYVIPALEEFEAQSVSAEYARTGSIKDSTTITSAEDTLSITVAVSSKGTVIPTQAHFSLYNNGAERFSLDDRNGYTVTTRSSTVYGQTTLYATISFNPRRDVNTGDALYVSFEDQSGVRYTPINVGYDFATPLSLKQFIFGMIGSPVLEDAITNSAPVQLLGDPLGNIDLGSVPGFDSIPGLDSVPGLSKIPQFKDTTYDYYPANVSEENKEYFKKSKTAHTLGWSANFSSDGEFDLSADTGDEAFDDLMESLGDGAPSSGGGFSASGSYSFSITPEIGFRLTTSTINGQIDPSGKHYFEDLVFYVKLTFDVSAEATISTPIYIDILLGARLSGNVAGIYHMYMAYTTSSEQDGLLPYDSQNFGLFKTFPNNPVAREGYIFLNPQIDLTLGVGIASCFITGTAVFNFDIDFQFTEARINAYADMTYSMDFGIQAFGIQIFHFATPAIMNPTIKLFNTPGTNSHINFGYEVEQTMNAELMSAADDDITQTRPVDRSYLANRTGWQVSDAVTLLDAEGSVEKELRNGTANNMQVQMIPISDNDDLLMLFVDDAPERSTGNKRAVYYSIYSASGDSWSEPAIIHDDGTPDDYPTLQNLGNGKILAAWSSAEREMPDDANLETMASAMNIEVAFFDTSSRTFGEPAVLTKTTEADYTADIMPRAAYDPETDRVILYYTKTEYHDLETLSDYGEAESIIAYLFYENGTWSNTGDAYSADELEGFTEEEIAEYKSDWYGQRFLEARLNLDSAAFPRIVSSDAIGYNGLALFAYTVDWDNSLNTSNDRDVLLQIYDFEQNIFTHVIRVTKETGSYDLPKLARSNNSTYLFYGEKPQGDGEHGVIRSLDVTYVLQNELYERVTDGENVYYVLRATSDPVTSLDSGEVIAESKTVDIVGDIVTECDTLSDYDAFVADDGRMFLLWTDTRKDGEGRNIYASLFNTGDGIFEKEGQIWSAPVALTDGGRDTYFSGLGAAFVGNSVFLVSTKGSYADASANSITQIRHTPFSKLVPDGDLTFDNPYAAAGDNVQVTATLKNPGLETFVAGENGVRVTFQVNGANAAETVYRGNVAGGSSIEVTTNVEIPEGNAPTVSVSCNGASVSTALQRGAVMRVENETLSNTVDETRATEFLYSAALSNEGNEPSGAVTLTVKSGETVLGEFTADVVQPGERVPVEIVLDIPDSAWNINDEGVGTLKADISARNGSKNFWFSNQDLSRQFDAEAIALMTQVTSVRSENVSIQTRELALLMPEIQGVDDGSVTVQWLSSDDEAIASIDRSNMILGVSPGATTLHGMVIPSTEVVVLNANGESVTEDWFSKIPESLQKPVTAQVTVLQGASESGYTVAFNSDGGSDVDSVTVESNGLVSEPDAPSKKGYEFDGWYLNGQPYDFSSPVTGNITLQAHWKKQSSSDSSGGAKKGCYVATSVYGSYDCPEVWTLRRFRDEVLADTWYGRLFIRVYYAVSPTAVKLFGDCEWFRTFWRGRLDKMVDNLQSEGFESTPYEDTQW